MHNISPNLIEKAKTAKSAEELLEIAKENNVEMTADEAKTYFAQLGPKSGELSDDDLDAVAGGKAGCLTYKAKELADQNIPNIVCPNCGAMGDWEYDGAGPRTQAFYCRQCKLSMYLHNDEDYSVLHTKGNIRNI